MSKPSFSSADFTSALLGLLPRGRVWPKELSSIQAQAASCFAPTFQRISDTAVDLIADAFPGTTSDLLSEWELTLGLPDGCTVPGSQTIAERQRAVAEKISAAGGPQRSYYLQMARHAAALERVRSITPPRLRARQELPTRPSDRATAAAG